MNDLFINLVHMHLKNDDLEKALAIKAFLEKHYTEHFSYDDLVHKFGMNKFKLKVAFKAVANCNVHEHVTKVRVENAKVFLECTDKTIREIAAKVGLDKSNLSIQFKKLTGKTPTQWRRYPGTENSLPFYNSDSSKKSG